jgi:hypothetical protein
LTTAEVSPWGYGPAWLSTDLGGDLRAPNAGKATLKTTSMSCNRMKADCEHRVAYHNILDKGDARDGALYARKNKWLAWCPRNGCRRWWVRLRHVYGWRCRGSGVRKSGVASARQSAARQREPERVSIVCCASGDCWPDQPPEGCVHRWVGGGWWQPFSLQACGGTEDSSSADSPMSSNTTSDARHRSVSRAAPDMLSVLC